MKTLSLMCQIFIYIYFYSRYLTWKAFGSHYFFFTSSYILLTCSIASTAWTKLRSQPQSFSTSNSHLKGTFYTSAIPDELWKWQQYNLVKFFCEKTNKQWPHTNIKALEILRSSTETAAAKTSFKSGFSYKNPYHGLHRGSCATGVWKNKQKTGHTQTLRHLKSGAQQYMKIQANTEKAAAKTFFIWFFIQKSWSWFTQRILSYRGSENTYKGNIVY